MSSPRQAIHAMNILVRFLAAGLMVSLLASCNRDSLQLPEKVEEAKDDGREASDAFVVSATAAKIGAAVDDQGAISEPQTSFAIGDTVFLSMEAKGRRLGDRVRVFWFHEDGKSRKEEEKTLTGPYVHFEYQPEETGVFHTEVDVNDNPIGLVDFEVK